MRPSRRCGGFCGLQARISVRAHSIFWLRVIKNFFCFKLDSTISEYMASRDYQGRELSFSGFNGCSAAGNNLLGVLVS